MFYIIFSHSADSKDPILSQRAKFNDIIPIIFYQNHLKISNLRRVKKNENDTLCNLLQDHY